MMVMLMTHRIVACVLWLACAVLVFASVYLGWAPEGDKTSAGAMLKVEETTPLSAPWKLGERVEISYRLTNLSSRTVQVFDCAVT